MNYSITLPRMFAPDRSGTFMQICLIIRGCGVQELYLADKAVFKYAHLMIKPFADERLSVGCAGSFDLGQIERAESAENSLAGCVSRPALRFSCRTSSS